MRISITCLTALLGLTAVADAQNAVLFTGRFPFVSLDSVNERPGGPISQISPYDFTYSIPGVPTAFPMLPATAMHAYLGDADADGDYLWFRDWKPTYFTDLGIAGVFVKHGVANPTWQDVYWTPRLNTAAAPIIVNTAGGPQTLEEGDWLRFLPNGQVEFFMTRAQMTVAAGVQTGSGNTGAGSLCQNAAGDLYLSPSQGGMWVNGNASGNVFAQDGAILKIDAASITYDSNGNVSNLAADSARLLIDEINGGPGGTLTVRQMVLNSGAQDRNGAPIVVAGIYARTGGLGLDPNGGTWNPTYPDATGAFPAEENLVWSTNAGSYGGTIFSTNNQGEVAVINGLPCGSTSPGVPADGAWLGVELDLANFQPTLFGMTIINLPTQQLIADQGDFGSLPDNTTQPTWDIDFYGAANQLVLLTLSVDTQPPAGVLPSVPTALIPLGFDASTWPDFYHPVTFTLFGFGLSNSLGYTTVTVSNPNPGGGTFAGFTFLAQGVGLATGSVAGFQLSSPVVVQLQ